MASAGSPYRVAFLGYYGSGRTSLIHSLLRGTFVDGGAGGTALSMIYYIIVVNVAEGCGGGNMKLD